MTDLESLDNHKALIDQDSIVDQNPRFPESINTGKQEPLKDLLQLTAGILLSVDSGVCCCVAKPELPCGMDSTVLGG